MPRPLDEASLVGAERSLREFFVAHTQWHLDQQLYSRKAAGRFIPSRLAALARELPSEELAREHDRISETYWTTRGRRDGITFPFPVGTTGYADPPPFSDSERVVFARVERARSNGMAFTTAGDHPWPGWPGPWRFDMRREGGHWRIDGIFMVIGEGKRARRRSRI